MFKCFNNFNKNVLLKSDKPCLNVSTSLQRTCFKKDNSCLKVNTMKCLKHLSFISFFDNRSLIKLL